MRNFSLTIASLVVALVIITSVHAAGHVNGNSANNHGATVSIAAHTCAVGNPNARATATGTLTPVSGPGNSGNAKQNHGQCVSAVAKTNGHGANAAATAATTASGASTTASHGGKKTTKKTKPTKKTKTNTKGKH